MHNQAVVQRQPRAEEYHKGINQEVPLNTDLLILRATEYPKVPSMRQVFPSLKVVTQER